MAASIEEDSVPIPKFNASLGRKNRAVVESVTFTPYFPYIRFDGSVKVTSNEIDSFEGVPTALLCKVNGPQNLTLQWKFGNSKSNFSSFQPFFGRNVTTVSKLMRTDPVRPCVRYSHSSTLAFFVEDKYEGYVYVCVATENNRDTVVGNKTMYDIIESIQQRATVYGKSLTMTDTLVNPNVVADGGSFTLRCLPPSTVPSYVTIVDMLTISRKSGTNVPERLADYYISQFPSKLQ
ncbi:uncharacterized protein LOC131936209, partial [Physella acuta]|uniref:uncharacterized protein LOC131936209 n=1 Tax=Physella acuta TaxID=109671 RepID=UPI0027DCE248